jgi:GTPase
MSSEKTESSAPRAGFVCLSGPTNAGKSTLMNAMIGQKVAIASPKPQTTRNRILGIHNVSEPPGQIVFVDTPGLHRPRGQLGQRMLQIAVRSLEETDLAVLVVDVARDLRARGALSEANRTGLETVVRSGVPVVVALNQIDKVGDKKALLPVLAQYAERLGGAEIVPISARTRDGLDRLERVILGHLPEGEPLYPPDLLSDQAERFLAAELIREKVILLTQQELPYSTAVEIEQWEEPSPPRSTLDIAAVIHVERDSQKGIVIGKGGERLKAIGIKAREELEEAFGTHVYLTLFVHVEKDWTKDKRRLTRMGY